jgi:hypothetical protein
VAELDHVEGALDDRAVEVGRDGGGVVGGVEDQDQEPGVAGPDQLDGLAAAGDGEVDHDRVDRVGEQRRPCLDGG